MPNMLDCQHAINIASMQYLFHAGKTATATACCPVYNSKLPTQALQWQLGIRSTQALLLPDLADMHNAP